MVTNDLGSRNNVVTVHTTDFDVYNALAEDSRQSAVGSHSPRLGHGKAERRSCTDVGSMYCFCLA